MNSAVDPAVLDLLALYDTPTICNAIEQFDIRPRDVGFAGLEVQSLFDDLPVMVGYAATATIRSDPGRPYQVQPLVTHVVRLPRPRIVVVQDLDDPPARAALWGEVNANLFSALGCLGAVTDGCVRDLPAVRELGFRLFARSVGASHGYVRILSVGTPVKVSGLTVAPGDLLHADRHGVVVVPTEIAADLPAAAEALVREEHEVIQWIQSAAFDPERVAGVFDDATMDDPGPM